MINGKRIAVVMPAYNAEKTLTQTLAELPDVVDVRLLTDDHSSDNTVELAKRLVAREEHLSVGCRRVVRRRCERGPVDGGCGAVEKVAAHELADQRARAAGTVEILRRESPRGKKLPEAAPSESRGTGREHRVGRRSDSSAPPIRPPIPRACHRSATP